MNSKDQSLKQLSEIQSQNNDQSLSNKSLPMNKNPQKHDANISNQINEQKNTQDQENQNFTSQTNEEELKKDSSRKQSFRNQIEPISKLNKNQLQQIMNLQNAQISNSKRDKKRDYIMKNFFQNNQKHSKSSLINPINNIQRINNEQRYLNFEKGQQSQPYVNNQYHMNPIDLSSEQKNSIFAKRQLQNNTTIQVLKLPQINLKSLYQISKANQQNISKIQTQNKEDSQLTERNQRSDSQRNQEDSKNYQINSVQESPKSSKIQNNDVQKLIMIYRKGTNILSKYKNNNSAAMLNLQPYLESNQLNPFMFGRELYKRQYLNQQASQIQLNQQQSESQLNNQQNESQLKNQQSESKDIDEAILKQYDSFNQKRKVLLHRGPNLSKPASSPRLHQQFTSTIGTPSNQLNQFLQDNRISTSNYKQNLKNVLINSESKQMNEFLNLNLNDQNVLLPKIATHSYKLPSLQSLKKEDMYDQLIHLKKEMNQLHIEYTHTKTKNYQLNHQLKSKNQFIDGLLKNTLQTNQLVTLSDDVIVSTIKNSPEKFVTLQQSYLNINSHQNSNGKQIAQLEDEIKFQTAECERLKNLNQQILVDKQKKSINEKTNLRNSVSKTNPNSNQINISINSATPVKQKLNKIESLRKVNFSNNEQSFNQDDKLQKLQQERLIQLQFDRDRLLELDQKKTEKINNLDKRIDMLENQKKMQENKNLEEERLQEKILIQKQLNLELEQNVKLKYKIQDMEQKISENILQKQTQNVDQKLIFEKQTFQEQQISFLKQQLETIKVDYSQQNISIMNNNKSLNQDAIFNIQKDLQDKEIKIIKLEKQLELFTQNFDIQQNRYEEQNQLIVQENLKQQKKASRQKRIEEAQQEQIIYEKCVKIQDISVQKGFWYLARILQLKRISILEIDQILSSNDSDFISIQQLAIVLEEILPLNSDETLRFSRFIIEDQDKDQVIVDINQSININGIKSRLMPFFKDFNRMFSQQNEELSINSINEFYNSQQKQDFENEIKNQNQMINFINFEKILENLNMNSLNQIEIECIYTFLCRGAQFYLNENDQQLINRVQLKNMILGFDPILIEKLFFQEKQKEELPEIIQQEDEKIAEQTEVQIPEQIEQKISEPIEENNKLEINQEEIIPQIKQEEIIPQIKQEEIIPKIEQEEIIPQIEQEKPKDEYQVQYAYAYEYQYYDEEDDDELHKKVKDQILPEDKNENLNDNVEIPTLLLSKLKELGLRNLNSSDENQIQEYSTVVGKILMQFSDSIKQNFPDLKDFCREIFRENLCSMYDKQKSKDEEWLKKGGNKKGEEIEVLQPDEFIKKIENQIDKTFSNKQKNAIEQLFQVKRLQDNIPYKDILLLMNILEFKDMIDPYKYFCLQDNQQKLNYENLDFRSIRLINRLINYLGSEQMPFSKFIEDILEKQEVKSGYQTISIDIIKGEKFFEKMKKCGIKKNENFHPNLCMFLCVDKKYKKILMLKKLKKSILDFSQSTYHQSFGLKKVNLYHDRINKENKNDNDKILQNNQKLEQKEKDIQEVSINNNKIKNTYHYEYYDEEDDDEKNNKKQENEQIVKEQLQIVEQKQEQIQIEQTQKSVEETKEKQEEKQGQKKFQYIETYEYYDEEDDQK